jgi:hypothetical protein
VVVVVVEVAMAAAVEAAVVGAAVTDSLNTARIPYYFGCNRGDPTFCTDVDFGAVCARTTKFFNPRTHIWQRIKIQSKNAAGKWKRKERPKKRGSDGARGRNRLTSHLLLSLL